MRVFILCSRASGGTYFCRMQRLVRNLLYSPVLLVLLWMLLHLIAGGGANWSFDDDFAYGRPVQRFLESAEMHYTDWSSMTLVAQVWMGAALSTIVGFSYEHLRWISILMHLSATLALYSCAMQLGVRRSLALIGAALFLMHPLVVLLSLYFATDLSFLGVFLWSVYFYLRNLRSHSRTDLFVATALAVFSFLIRDVAVIIVPAYAAALFFAAERRSSFLWRTAFVALSLFAVYSGWRYWLAHFHGMPALIDFSRQRLIETWTHPLQLLSSYSRNLVYGSCYLGLSLVPLSISVAPTLARRSRTWQRVLCLCFAIVTSVALWITPRAFEHMSEQLLNPFVPYSSLPSIHVLISPVLPLPPTWLLGSVCILGFCSSAVLLLGLLHYVPSRAELRKQLASSPGLTLVVASLFVYTMLVYSQWIIHRYYVVSFALLLLALVYVLQQQNFELRGWNVLSLSLGCMVMLLLGSANAHDFMAHQRAAVQVYTVAEQDFGLNAQNLDGGFSYNSMRSFHRDYVKSPDKNWWWVQSDDYVITEAPAEGMVELYRAEYSRWLPFGAVGRIILQQNVAHRRHLDDSVQKVLSN